MQTASSFFVQDLTGNDLINDDPVPYVPAVTKRPQNQARIESFVLRILSVI
jgi:hypothetical protein